MMQVVYKLRITLLICLVFIVSLVFVGGGDAQEALKISIHDVDDSLFPKVIVYLAVTDANGRPVSGLGEDLFSVYDQGDELSVYSVSEVVSSDMPITVVLVVDTSGSMLGTPLAETKAAAVGFIESLGVADKVGLVTFSDGGTVASAITEEKQSVIDAINGLSADGNSPFFDSLELAISQLKGLPPGRKAIIVLSDGHDNGSLFTFQETAQEAQQWATPIYPIGFGAVNAETISKIASRTGGYAQTRPDTSELQSAFDTLRTLLRQHYVLEFTSKRDADGSNNSFTITLTYQGPEYSAAHTYSATPGEITIEIPDRADGQVVGGDVKLSPFILAPAELESVAYQVDSKPIVTLQESPFEYIWDTGSIDEGDHVLSIVATDKVGNSGEKEISLYIRPAVILEWITPVDGDSVSSSTPLQLQIDSLAGTEKVEYFLDDKSLGVSADEPFEFDWYLTDVQPGEHRLKAVVTDVNNKASGSEITVNVPILNNYWILGIAILVVVVAIIVIVPLSVRRRRSMVGAAVGAGTSASSTDNGRAVLIELSGNNPNTKWSLAKEELRIGRKRDANDVHAAGRSASRQHAVIQKRGPGYVLYNLNPSNPTFINGSPVEREANLSNGDLIQIGDSTFRVQLG